MEVVDDVSRQCDTDGFEWALSHTRARISNNTLAVLLTIFIASIGDQAYAPPSAYSCSGLALVSA